MLPYKFRSLNFRSLNFRSGHTLRFATMLLLGCVLSSLPAMSQPSQTNQPPAERRSDTKMATPDAQAMQKKIPATGDQLAPDAAVITINGFCPGGAHNKEAPAWSTQIMK